MKLPTTINTYWCFALPMPTLTSLVPLCYRYSEALIPSHPCLSLVASSEQHLQRYVARRLIQWRNMLLGEKICMEERNRLSAAVFMMLLEQSTSARMPY